MREFYATGTTRPFRFRTKQLITLKRAVLKYEAEINRALYEDLRKTPEEAWVTETGLLLQEINHALKHLKQWMRPERVGTNLLNFPSTSYLYPSSKGVVLVIGTWNFPLQLLLIPFAGAVAAGNCVVLKPSEFAPATAAVIERIIAEIFPKELALVVQGEGAEVVPAMMNTFRFDHVFYTGSVPVGKSILQMAAKELVPVTLELGGKNPCIIEKDADLRVAARRITLGKFTNAGQMCVSPDYLLARAEIKDALVDLVRGNIAKFYGEHPTDGYGYGKIVNEKQFDKLVRYLSQGRIVAGGEYDRPKRFIAPTILEDVAPNASLMQEEIFGPILPVFSFRTNAEAINIIGSNPNPLSFYVFTRSREKEKEWIERIQFGTGCVNNSAWQFSNHYLPFGGVGQSGIGGYHGKHSFDVFTHRKAVMKTPTWFDPAIKYPPFKGKLRVLKWILR
ncbi:MAG TPA: aldehyde dehydrogenase family protein [Terrimicrobiaceae bacterium]